jgi:SAM-dependent methyltransferase
MRNIDLKALMESLYSSMDYYASIMPDGVINYEEDYHYSAIDPDGIKRDLRSERTQFLKGVDEIIQFLNKIKPGKFLDIGCGLGWILSYLNNSWDKHGIEISKVASIHASQFGKIHNGTLETFPDSDYDVIVMNHVIEHLQDPISAIKKIHSLLKAKGIFIIGTPDFDSAAARRYGKNFRLLHDPTHISLFSLDSMHRFLRDHGFKIDYVEYPYFNTPWFTENNLKKILNTEGISPPFYGSVMTFFCTKN